MIDHEERTAKFRAAAEQLRLPHDGGRYKPIRQWWTERTSLFERVPVSPAGSHESGSLFIATAMLGEHPTSGLVAHLGACALDEHAAGRLLGDVALVALEPENYRQLSEARLVSLLVRSETRPVDLDTMRNAAMVLECAAHHIQPQRAAAHLVSLAALVWWAAGQPFRARQCWLVADKVDATWEFTTLVGDILRYRHRPSWMAQD